MIQGKLIFAALTLGALSGGAAEEVLDFNRDVRPILSENCFHCHGPDADAREADLRLDTYEGAIEGGEFAVAVVPGKPAESELIERIFSKDPDDLMPPPESNRKLTQKQKETLKRWIEEGARYEEHWAWVAPTRATPPPVSDDALVSNPIDAFLLARLERDGLTYSPPADPTILLRRLSLDLIGLPPSPGELREFEEDYAKDPDKTLEAAVDRLLASPRFGERWARPWLDLARYADSNGFQADQLRPSWAYRDWVIDALNANMPYDQFTIEQLAGDLLPDPTLSQKIATGFHRTVTCNVEAGVHAEENRVNQVADRVNTTGTVWLGVTMECAQCHDHKYDPFSMKDYYSFFAFFNNTPLEVTLPEGVNDVQHNFIGPYLDLPEPEEKKRKREEVSQSLAEAKKEREALKKAKKEKSPEAKELNQEIARLDKELKELEPDKTLVMVEMDEPRTTHIMKRGDYLAPAGEVQADVPELLPPLESTNAQPNRLDLARWLVREDNPLTARVAVNRWWAEIFGHGIVATEEDFGTQAEPPTHPELLDWLAVEFMESGWDMKHLLKKMVMSRAYRQSSRTTPVLQEGDPRNLLYARAPRFRMDAERLRDNALSVSGLLSTKMHGKPVMPYQPPNMWRQIGRNEPKWIEDKDEDRWRRGIYIVYRRAAPYPSMVNFDAPDRASCTVKRPRTNTPLQALTLLNDPAYVEMAYAFADRVLTEAKTGDRIDYAFRLATGRAPKASERTRLGELLDERTTHFGENPEAVDTLLGNPNFIYEARHDDRKELAAWFFLGNVLLNLDEAMTKQ